MVPGSAFVSIYPASCRALLLTAAALLALPASAQKPIAEVAASDASIRGSVVLAGGGTRVMTGSSVTAGESTASMRLLRGGEVRVCPRTSLALSSAPNGRDLQLGMGVGALEMHYTIGNNADSIVTPDFRILLAGPGTFHLAIAADARGNTCVRTLEGNTASVIITEQLGDGVYQVRPNDQVTFRNGGVSNAESAVPPDCGCPVPRVPVQQAQAAPPAAPATAPPVIAASAQPAQTAAALPAPTAAPSPVRSEPLPVPAILLAPAAAPPNPPNVTAPPPALHAGEVHVQVDAPFVFRAVAPAIPDAPIVARVRLQQLPPLLLDGSAVAPPPPAEIQTAKAAPPAAKPQKKRGVFGRIGSFFATVFH
jgi:hypothetical protein